MKKQTKKALAKAKAKPVNIAATVRAIHAAQLRQFIIIDQHLGCIDNAIGMINERIDAQRMEGYALAQAKVDREQGTPKPQGLQPGDYTDASKETADELTAMGYAWLDEDRYRLVYIEWGLNREHLGMMVNKGGVGPTYITPSEFLARAAVTARDLGLEPMKVPTPEEIEAAKPVGFGTRVYLRDHEHEVWKVGCDEPTDEGYWRLCPSKCGNLNTLTAKRHEFKVLDPQP